MSFYLPFLVGLMILAVIFRQNAVLTVFYLLFGVYFAARWSSRHALRSVGAERKFQNRVFLNQKIPVELVLHNKSRLPVIWLQVYEGLPLQLIAPPFVQQAVSIAPRSSASIHYEMNGRKRGYYPVGPFRMLSGDLLGMMPDQEITGGVEHITVYPQIVPMRGLNLFSRSPFGELRSHNPIFEDTSRAQGKRDYVMGDSLRRVDWKTTASLGRLQVKTYSPSMALETVVCLNMNPEDYDPRLRFDLIEVAVIAASSTANWVSGKKQPVGLVTNGADPLADHSGFQTIPPRKGSGGLMAVLDVLARVEAEMSVPFLPLVRCEMSRMAWGTTMVLVTGIYNQELEETIFQAKRMGFNAAVILVGLLPNMTEILQRGRRYHFRVWNIRHQDELEVLE